MAFKKLTGEYRFKKRIFMNEYVLQVEVEYFYTKKKMCRGWRDAKMEHIERLVIPTLFEFGELKINKKDQYVLKKSS